MSCQRLAQVYATTTGHTIPASDAPIGDSTGALDSTRSDWLLHRQYCCQGSSPTTAIICDAAQCAATTQTLPPAYPNTTAFTVAGLPMTIIRETGFLAWVNERGMQCINALTGIVDRTPVTDANPYVDVGITKAAPTTYCVNECTNALPSSTDCFTCVKNALENPDNKLQDACPALWNGSDPVDTQLMQDSLTCHACIGSRSANLVKTTSTTDSKGNVTFTHTYNANSFDTMWTCITGASSLSAGAIAGIVIGIVVFLVLLGVLIWYLVKKKRASTPKVTTPSPTPVTRPPSWSATTTL